MALERNNTTLRFDGDIDGEFDRMLRRHLKQGGAPVAACGGFDPDQASAFLENALSSGPRAQYEAHLAGCASCRGHVIALSRLMTELEPAPLAASPAAAASPSTWTRWIEAIRGWRLLPEAPWGWQTASLASAGLVLLFGFVAIRSWRSSAPAMESNAGMNVAVAGANNAGGNEGMNRQPGGLEASPVNPADGPRPTGFGAPIPRPSIQPNQSAQASQDAATASAGVRLEDAARNRQVLESQVASLPPAQVSSTLGMPDPRGVAAPMPAAALPQSVIAMAPEASPDEPSRLGPSSDDNPMRTAGKKADAKRAGRASEKNAASKSNWPSWADRALAFAPTRSADKKEAKATLPATEETPSLVHRIRDRIFRFEEGLWIDQEYKPEMQWRITKLVYGSPEFQAVLDQDPQLKPYFEKRSILVVWRDKIYKVVPR